MKHSNTYGTFKYTVTTLSLENTAEVWNSKIDHEPHTEASQNVCQRQRVTSVTHEMPRTIYTSIITAIPINLESY